MTDTAYSQTSQPSTSSTPSDETRYTSAGVRASLLEYLHACPVCGDPEMRHYSRVPALFAKGEYIHYEHCCSCDVVMRNPRVPPDERLAKYEDKILPDAEKAIRPKRQRHYRFMMRALKRHTQDIGKRFFDFGCGAGGFLLAARDAGFDVHGLEINRDLAHFVTDKYGIPVHQGLIDDPGFANERFDVIVSHMVFEHLLDPKATLHDLLPHLNTPGLLLIEVPNLLAIKEQIKRGSTMNDSHLFYFSARGLSRLLEDAGLRVLEVHEGLRPYRFLPKGDALPYPLLRAGERVAATLRVRTALSVLARRDA
ncbi:MAG: class I SAM-dependent methyltransferase [Acidobacteriota bacterium]